MGTTAQKLQFTVNYIRGLKAIALRDARTITASDFDGMTAIEKNAFKGCTTLTSVILPNSMKIIYDGCFQNCTNLTSVTLPSGIEEIRGSAFNTVGITGALNFGNSLTLLGGWTFAGCQGLTSVTIGTGITQIGDCCFYNCTSLTSITIKATTPPTLKGTSAFSNTGNCPIYVPAASVNAYKVATNFSAVASRIQAIP